MTTYLILKYLHVLGAIVVLVVYHAVTGRSGLQ